MAGLGLVATYTDGRVAEAHPTPLAEVQTERHFGISIDTMSLREHLYFLAWASLRQTGDETEDFDAFLAKVADISVKQSDAPVPTQPAPLPDDSSD